MSSWHPKPGTLAERAFAWLEEQPEGTEVTSSRWASAIGVEVTKLILAMQDPVAKGALKRLTKHGQARPHFYSLPEKKRAASEPQPLDDDALIKESVDERWPVVAPPPPAELVATVPSSVFDVARVGAAAPSERNYPQRDSQHVLKAEAARPDATDRETHANASPDGGPMGVWQPAAAGPLRVALWSDGTLVVERRGERIVFEREEARQIVDYLDAISLEILRQEAPITLQTGTGEAPYVLHDPEGRLLGVAMLLQPLKQLGEAHAKDRAEFQP